MHKANGANLLFWLFRKDLEIIEEGKNDTNENIEIQKAANETDDNANDRDPSQKTDYKAEHDTDDELNNYVNDKCGDVLFGNE